MTRDEALSQVADRVRVARARGAASVEVTTEAAQALVEGYAGPAHAAPEPRADVDRMVEEQDALLREV